MAMFEAAALIALVSGISFPTEQMDMVDHLLKALPEIKRDDESAAADIGLWVRPDGHIVNCEVVRYTGAKASVDRVCPAFDSYSFKSAHAGDGTELHAYLITTISLFPDRSPGKRNVLMKNLRQLREDSEEVSFERSLFLDERSPSDFLLTLDVDEQGIVSHCEKGSKKTSVKTADLACNKLVGRAVTRRFDENGEAVRYLMRFGFTPS